MNQDSNDYDLVDMKWLNELDQLDDFALEQIIKQDYTNIEVNVDPNQDLNYADNVTSDGSNFGN